MQNALPHHLMTKDLVIAVDSYAIVKTKQNNVIV